MKATSTQQRYIITGGAGFIGSHMVDVLLKDNHHVIAVDNLITGSRSNLLEAMQHPNFEFYRKDIRDVSFMHKLVSKNTNIIHLAATVGVEKVCQDPYETAQNNYHGTEVILDLARRYNCRVFFASTSEVYGDSTGEMTESDNCNINVLHQGRSAYTLSKLYSELLCLTYFSQYKVPVVIGRFFNTIGPRQSAAFGMVAPRFIQNAMKGSPLTVYDDGQQTRSFCHVYDTVSAVKMLIENKEAYGQIFNIGNPKEVTILKLAHFIKGINNSNAPIQLAPLPEERSNGKDIKNRRPSIAKIWQYTGWVPQYNWQQAISHTNTYYKAEVQANTKLVKYD